MADTVNEVLDQATEIPDEPDYGMVVTLQEACDYLGIDYADAMVKRNVRRAISAADSYLMGAVGENYPAWDPRAKELALALVEDLYTNRGTSDKVTNTVKKYVTDSLLQLRLELRRATGNDV